MNLHFPREVIGIGLLIGGIAFAQTPTPPLTDTSGEGLRAPRVAAALGTPERVAATAAPGTAPAEPTIGFDDAPLRRDPTIASRPAYRPAPVGTATRNLLRQQVAGQQAGNALPVLGASATLSHQRYLDSFKHPIPERFESRVSGKSAGTN